ncbi:UNVERIFIED_CONTAM: hypothetical protein Sangu_2205200 [Sesamum angustifolium]|uniref:Chlorophyll a-b binding protein, chloroplastic n=1 Tax=Sesamum angustifolium TaxID=2727405 RepID=A0AAW2LFS0_9LAMI
MMDSLISENGLVEYFTAQIQSRNTPPATSSGNLAEKLTPDDLLPPPWYFL